jgi:tRNA(Ile)-lysidine synthase
VVCKIVNSISKIWPPAEWSRWRVLVAVSGGADSVALLLALLELAADSTQRTAMDRGLPAARLNAATDAPIGDNGGAGKDSDSSWANRGIKLHVAHYNHRWRGAESDADERFVRELCSRLAVPLAVEAAERGGEQASSEAQARTERYRFLARTAHRVGARYVVTAHTASDRVETLLHNLFRGTGIRGVCQPRRLRALDEQLMLVRPLLNCTREDVEAYLAMRQQTYRSDSSNRELRYRRNYLRHDLLPTIRERYGESLESRLLSFSQHAEQLQAFIERLAEQYLDSLPAAPTLPPSAERPPGTPLFAFPSRDQLPAEWPVVREALCRVWDRYGWPRQSMSSEHWESLRVLWEQAPEDDGRMDERKGPGLSVLENLPSDLQVERLVEPSGKRWLVIRAAG